MKIPPTVTDETSRKSLQDGALPTSPGIVIDLLSGKGLIGLGDRFLTTPNVVASISNYEEGWERERELKIFNKTVNLRGK